MKKTLLFTIFILMAFHVIAQVYTLPSEYENEDVCLKAQNQWAIAISTAESDIEAIEAKLNFSNYQIEAQTCNSIHTSALAYLDRASNRRYILINENMLQNLNQHYYAHLFVIAHEFSHHILGHFGLTVLPTKENKRNMELQADRNAASIVKKFGGTADDCIYALNQMHHPVDDTYSDHPTLQKRIQAVYNGFPNIPVAPPITINYNDYFKSFSSVSLLKYNTDVTSTSILDYNDRNNMIPKSIIYYDNHFWIYWEKTPPDVSNFFLCWNYDVFPNDTIQRYFNEGYNIEFLEKINNRWFVVLAKHENQLPQETIAINKSDMLSTTNNYIADEYADKLKPLLDDDYAIQNIISWDNYSFLFLLAKTGINGYSWCFRDNYADFEKWYQAQGTDDYNYMYCYKYIDNKYFGFMEKKPSVSTWSISHFDGNDISSIADYLKDGYYIDNIVVDDYIRFTLGKK